MIRAKIKITKDGKKQLASPRTKNIVTEGMGLKAMHISAFFTSTNHHQFVDKK